MKFLLIVGGIFFLIYMIFNSIKNRILSSFTNQNFPRNNVRNDEVVYEKDNTVILKGEAKNDNKKYNY